MAALSVAILHISWYVADTPKLYHAFLAVDFFFILSGFIIANAYEERLFSNMGFLSFAKLRVVRLWPLIVAGLALGAVYLILRNHLQPAHAVTSGYVLGAIIFGLILVPLNVIVGSEGYPLDLPCWSLFFEMMANALYAFLCRYRLLSAATLCLIIGYFLLGLFAVSSLELWDAPHHFTNRSWLAFTFLDGSARVGFGFFVGVALYRYRNHRFVRGMPQLHPGIACVFLLVLFAMPPFSTNTYDLVVTILALPLIVAASVHRESHGLEAVFSRFSGWLSYPLYVLHYPTMFVAVGAFKYLDKGDRFPVAGVEVTTLLSCILAAYLLGRFYDEPARAWLAARLRSRPSGPHLNLPQLPQTGIAHL